MGHQRLVIFVCVKSVDDYPGVLSLVLLRETTATPTLMESGRATILDQRRGHFDCRSPNHVPVVTVTTQKATPVHAGSDSLPEWSQTFHGCLQDSPSTESVGNGSTQEQEPEYIIVLFKKRKKKQASSMCLLTCPQIPNCDAYRVTKTTLPAVGNSLRCAEMVSHFEEKLSRRITKY